LRARAFDCFYVLVRERGDTRESLHQVQRHTLGRDQHVGKSDHARDHLAGLDRFAVRDKRFELLLRVERQENFLGRFKPCDDHVLAGNETRASTRVTRNDRLRGDVAASEVFA